MKKIISTIILGFFAISIQSQDLNLIKQQKVFFVVFDAKDEYMRKIDLSRIKRDSIFNYIYYFYNKEEKKRKEFDFSFRYWKYKTFDDAHNKINETMLIRLNKSFLRRNKDIIITREFMERIGEDAITELLADGFNHVFLIDKGEIKNNKILLREVQFDYIPYE